jgi:hypothetical protein
MHRLLLSVLVASLGICLPRVVRADPPGTAGRGQIGAVLGGGIGLNDVGTTVGNGAGAPGRANLYGFGFGPRGGYTFPEVPVYLGGVFMFFVGERQTFDAFGVNGKVRAGYMLLGIEGGYDIGVGPVIIRPTLWLGPAILRAKACGDFNPLAGGGCTADSDTALLLAPGASVIYAFDDIPLWLGGEMRFTIAAKADHQTALMIGFNIGMLFGD